MAKAKHPTYQALPTDEPIQVSEPFRVFFPLGLIAATIGALLWPMHYGGFWETYPGQQHPRLLIFGFGAAFVAGFLGTAWPRFLETEALRKWEVGGLAGIWLVAQAFYLFGSIRAGDLAAAWFLVVLIVILALRFRKAKDLPPPGFTLAFVSVLFAIGVLGFWVLLPTFLYPRLFVLAKLIAYQAFLLLPILGVGSYLFVRFFSEPGKRPFAKPPKHRAHAVWSAALTILVSLALEAFGFARTGNLLRMAGFLIWAVGAVPAIWRAKAPNTRAWALRIGLAMIPLSFLLRAIWPTQVFAYEHLLFLGGFGIVILLTADRVVLGHCVGMANVGPVSKMWRWILWFLLLTAATRVSADLKVSLIRSHQVYAALMWAIVIGCWAWLHRKHLWSGIAPD